MKKLFIFILVLNGCSTYITGTCVPQAVFNAWVWEQETRRPARIVICHTSDDFIDHAQAHGWDGEKYIPLKMIYNEVHESEDECKEGLHKIFNLQRILDDHNEKLESFQGKKD